MSDVTKYLFRKVVYAVAAGGTVAVGAYLFDKPEIAEWTIKGVGGAALSGIWGSFLSGRMGGALSKNGS